MARRENYTPSVRTAFLFLASILLLSGGVLAKRNPHSDKPVLYLAGDSTMRADDGIPMGWGSKLQAYFDETKLTVENDGLGGSSSRSYRREGWWQKVADKLKPGDFVLLQFGHNDTGSLTEGLANGSLPGNGAETKDIVVAASGQHETVHTYGWYLRRSIAEAKARGATVLVCSPVVRNAWQDGHVIRNSSDYGLWAREAAAEAGATFLDLNAAIAKRYDAAGPAQVAALFAPKDILHTTEAGAQINAECFVSALRELPDCQLAEFLKPGRPR